MTAVDARMVHERLSDFEWWDSVVIRAVPRWKESEMSGDEWRRSAVIRFVFKGKTFLEKTYSNMDVAASALPFLMKLSIGELYKDIDSEAFIAHEKQCCDNPGCDMFWRDKYKLKKLWSQNCSFSKDPEVKDVHFRKFCEKHRHRGDCGLDDSDANYILIEERPQ